MTDQQKLSQIEQEFWTWGEYNEELLRQMFTTAQFVREYSPPRIWSLGPKSLQEQIAELREAIQSKTRTLSSIKERLEIIPLAPGLAPVVLSQNTNIRSNDKVFVVHGHDEAAREATARFLTKLGLEPIILHEQASRGRTVVEKLEHNGAVGFAVVLLTPDDIGGKSADELQPRARQNVILELGYFLARLGRQNVCALYRGDVEIPSDYMGVIYVPYDDGGGWRLRLAKELKDAGFPIDMNDAI
jgi:predicted nucleotide-binding protein